MTGASDAADAAASGPPSSTTSLPNKASPTQDSSPDIAGKGVHTRVLLAGADRRTLAVRSISFGKVICEGSDELNWTARMLVASGHGHDDHISVVSATPSSPLSRLQPRSTFKTYQIDRSFKLVAHTKVQSSYDSYGSHCVTATVSAHVFSSSHRLKTRHMPRM